MTHLGEVHSIFWPPSFALHASRADFGGAMVLGQVEHGTIPKDKFLDQLDEYLERDNDRELFGLPAKADKANSATEFGTSSRGVI